LSKSNKQRWLTRWPPRSFNPMRHSDTLFPLIMMNCYAWASQGGEALPWILKLLAKKVVFFYFVW